MGLNGGVTPTLQGAPDSVLQGIIGTFPAEAGPAKIHEIYNFFSTYIFFMEASALKTMD